jgi:hypothetical protein
MFILPGEQYDTTVCNGANLKNKQICPDGSMGYFYHADKKRKGQSHIHLLNFY